MVYNYVYGIFVGGGGGGGLEVFKPIQFLFYFLHNLRQKFPASRGLFSIVFAELTGARKRDLCPGSKRTVLSIRHDRTITSCS